MGVEVTEDAEEVKEVNEGVKEIKLGDEGEESCREDSHEAEANAPIQQTDVGNDIPNLIENNSPVTSPIFDVSFLCILGNRSNTKMDMGHFYEIAVVEAATKADLKVGRVCGHGLCQCEFY